MQRDLQDGVILIIKSSDVLSSALLLLGMPCRGLGGHLLCIAWQEEEQMLDMVVDKPGINTRALARRHNLPQTTLHKCLQRYSLYPYQPQQVQALLPGDRQHRAQFCRWLVEKANEDVDFVSRVLCTDELQFTQMGIVSTDNIHRSAHENPHFMLEGQHQVHYSLNVWVGLLGDCIIVSYLLREHLTATTYYAFIDEALPVLQEHLSLATREHVLARRSTNTLWESCSYFN
jgi:hypothetical protein